MLLHSLHDNYGKNGVCNTIVLDMVCSMMIGTMRP